MCMTRTWMKKSMPPKSHRKSRLMISVRCVLRIAMLNVWQEIQDNVESEAEQPEDRCRPVLF